MLCPVCKINDALTKDYRNNNGCVGSIPSCFACMHVDDHTHRELMSTSNAEEAREYLIALFSKETGRRNSWLNHIVWPEEERHVKERMEQLFEGSSQVPLRYNSESAKVKPM